MNSNPSKERYKQKNKAKIQEYSKEYNSRPEVKVRDNERRRAKTDFWKRFYPNKSLDKENTIKLYIELWDEL